MSKMPIRNIGNDGKKTKMQCEHTHRDVGRVKIVDQ